MSDAEMATYDLDPKQEFGVMPTETRRGRIESLAGGILSGTIMSRTPAETTRVVVAVNGRVIGPVPIAWPQTTDQCDIDDAISGSWLFDARRLPPDLLLDDRLAFEIRRQRDPKTRLDVREIETSQLLPIATLPRGQGALEGYIDAVDGGTIRGWVWDRTNWRRRIEVQFFVDGIFRGIFEANAPRPDLKATGRGDGLYGFTIPARGCFAKTAGTKPQVHIVALEPECWRVPFAPHTIASRRRLLALPRLRDLPTTTRDLVAILASAEPFPKKAYVIDRLTRKMPDAFTADYILLAIEFLRVEMVKTVSPPSMRWEDYITSWWRQRVIRGQIRRLAALADATRTAQKLLRGESFVRPMVSPPTTSRDTDARP